MKTEFKRITFTCDKCKGKIIHETDFLNLTEVKAVHKCKKAKEEKVCSKK